MLGLLEKSPTDKFDKWDLYLQFASGIKLKFKKVVVVDFFVGIFDKKSYINQKFG